MAQAPAPIPSAASPTIKTPQELVHVKHKITLRQYKIWIVVLQAYREAYKAGDSVDKDGYRHVSRRVLSQRLGYDPSTKELKADLEAIRREPIFYNVMRKNGQTAERGVGFVSEWEVTSNQIGYVLPPFLMRCVENLDLDASMFQLLNWTVFNSFAGKYEAILYKFCKDYVGIRQTPLIPLPDFREYMGLRESEYPEYKALKRHVIAGPIEKINASDYSDISVSLIEEKDGRKVAALRFLVSPRQGKLDLGDNPAFAGARVTIPAQVQARYLAEYAEDEIALAIERANNYADDQAAKGVEVTLGAIYTTAITQGWGKEVKAKLADEKKKTERTKKEQAVKVAREKKVAAAELEQAEARSAVRLTALGGFDALSGDERTSLIAEFGLTLKGLNLADFKKRGVTSKLIAPLFADWLSTRLLASE